MTISVGCRPSWNTGLAGHQLNPNQYRPHIAAIDRVLFQHGPLNWRDRQNLEQEILSIADAADDDPNNAIALEESLDLRLLSTMAASGQVSGPVVNSELTQHWRRIRGSLFIQAPWFRNRPADPIAPAQIASTAK